MIQFSKPTADEVKKLSEALRRNGNDGAALHMDPLHTGWMPGADEVPDDEVISAIKSVPTHYFMKCAAMMVLIFAMVGCGGANKKADRPKEQFAFAVMETDMVVKWQEHEIQRLKKLLESTNKMAGTVMAERDLLRASVEELRIQLRMDKLLNARFPRMPMAEDDVISNILNEKFPSQEIMIPVFQGYPVQPYPKYPTTYFGKK